MTSSSDIGELRAEVARRLGKARLDHVAGVAETAAGIAAVGGWPDPVRDGALRAAWIHDACKEDGLEAWVSVIEAAGEERDSWALAHASHLLHAPAAAAWARERGERDPEVLAAVRHHPTGSPSWGPVGRILFVADFCEPGRAYANEVGTAALRSRAGQGEEGLREAALGVLAIRLAWLVERFRPAHPRSWETWNAWVRAGAPAVPR